MDFMCMTGRLSMMTMSRGHSGTSACSNAYNFARRLKTLAGLTPYEFICKVWTSKPQRFKTNPIQQMPGLNI